MEKIIYRQENEKLFHQYWDQVSQKKQAGPSYLWLTINYQLAISRGKDLLIDDQSFIFLIDGQPAAAVFLPIEQCSGEKSITSSGDYVPAPLFLTGQAQKEVFGIIDEIAKKFGVAKIKMTIDPMENESYNFLQKYDYLDTSVLSYLFDLTDEDLLRSCRRGHRCDIKKILNDKNFKVFYIDAENPLYDIHEEYCSLHHKCSGRVTRAKESFDLQFEKLKQGQAVLFGLAYQGKNVCFNYFEFNYDKAVYASGADDPEFDRMPLYHSLIFSAMKYLKNKGIRYVDTEQPVSPSAQFDYYPDNKQLNIALFKRGFGGDFKQNFRGIKYFSKDAFEKDMKNFGLHCNLL